MNSIAVIREVGTETMGFSEENRAWIREEIQKALFPSGFRRIAERLRYWGLLAACVAVFLALVTTVVTLAIFTTNKISQESEFRGATNQKLISIDARLQGIEKILLGIRADKVANSPVSKQTIAEAKSILDTAKRSSVKLSDNVVEQSGKSFVEAASKEPAAWVVALDFASYRSSQNEAGPLEGFYPFDTTADPNVAISRYFLNFPGGASPPRFTTSKARTSVNLSARLEPIGKPQKQDGPDGPVSFLGVGGAIILDGVYGRHVVFKDVEIHYNGGPLILDEVTFVNCRFVLDNDDLGRQLASNILSTDKVSFKTQG
jgi:hypothetical protein